MLEDQLNPDDRRVFELALAILGYGPLPALELVARIRAAGGFEHLVATPDELVDDLLDVLASTNRFWAREHPIVHRIDLLLDGVVLTHRLAEREIERGGIELVPDIGVIDYDIDYDDDIVVDGVVVRTEIDDDWYGWVFPDGLPETCRAGHLIGIRRVGSTFGLLHGPQLEAEVATTDSKELRALIAARINEAREDGLGLESTEIVMGALCSSPLAFRVPMPPLSELVEVAGGFREGDYFGPADVDWEPPGVRMVRALREDLFDRWEFDECCEQAFELVADAWGAHILGEEPPHGPAEIRTALAHNSVSLAMLEHWDEFGTDASQVESFLAPVVATPRRNAAPALFVLASTLERTGRALEAERLYGEAVMADADYMPPLEALGIYAFERGDIGRAISLLDRSTGTSRRHPVAELLADLAPPVEGVGRNDPCPCGSGRKFKVCHRGKPLDDSVSHAKLLLHKALLHLHRRDREVIDRVLPPGADADRLADDDFVVDVAMFEGGSLAVFLEERGDVLPPDDFDEGWVWLTTPRRMYEIIDLVPGERLYLRDLTSGARVVLQDRRGSLDRRVGEYMLARIARPDSEPTVVGVPIAVPMHGRESLIEVLDADGDADDLVAWYAATTAPPSLRNRTGHELVFCEITVDPGTVEPDNVVAGLDACFGADARDPGAVIWQWTVVAPDGVHDERLIAGQIALEGGALGCSTNSEERADQLLAMLRSTFPKLTVETDVRTPFDEMPLPESDTPALQPLADPELQAALKEYARHYEESWIDMSIPALDGMTPRQAVDDPTRRDDVERLVASMPSAAQMGAMDPARVRELLGLDKA